MTRFSERRGSRRLFFRFSKTQFWSFYTSCPGCSYSKQHVGRQLSPSRQGSVSIFSPPIVLNRLEFRVVGVGTGSALNNRHLPAVRLWCRGRCASASASCQRRTELPTMIRGMECRGPARRMRALHVGGAL